MVSRREVSMTAEEVKVKKGECSGDGEEEDVAVEDVVTHTDGGREHLNSAN